MLLITYFALNSLYCLTPMFVQEVKVLLITYFALNSLIILVLAIGAVLAYVFREQVKQISKLYGYSKLEVKQLGPRLALGY